MELLPVVEIIRLEENFRFGTFGSVRLNKQLFCTSLELPDKLNRRNESCIPAQQYICERFSSTRYSDTWQVMNVPDRSFVLWHPGNWKIDTRGCILVGQYPEKLSGTWENRGVQNSGTTFKNFMYELRHYSRFSLTIVEHYG